MVMFIRVPIQNIPKPIRSHVLHHDFAVEDLDRFESLLYLCGGFKQVLFLPLPGEKIQFDEHILQMGWFNHQPAVF